MNRGFSQEKFYVLLGPLPSFVSLGGFFFPSCLHPLSHSTSLAPSGLERHNCVSWKIISSWPCFRSSDIFHHLSIFYPLPFFSRPLPSPFRCHLSSYPENHFHLASHTNILTEFLLHWQKKIKNGKSKTSQGTGQDRIFHQSKLWEIVHKQMEKYRYAGQVKMRKEVERKINTIRRMHRRTNTRV